MQILPHVCQNNEKMKPKYTILWSFSSIIPLLLLIWWRFKVSRMVKILQKIYKLPYFCFCLPYEPTDRCAARPTVGLSWKALHYWMPQPASCLAFLVACTSLIWYHCFIYYLCKYDEEMKSNELNWTESKQKQSGNGIMHKK